MKKKICWVTPDCFVDVDYNSGVIEEMLKYFDIDSIVVLSRNGRFIESDFEEVMRKHANLKLCFVYMKHRARDLRTFVDYFEIFRMVKSSKADVNYINFVPESPYALPLYLLPKSNTIFTAHDGYVKDSFKFAKISRLSFNVGYKKAQYVNLFSPKQEEIFLEHFPGKKTFVIPLGLKDFGKPTVVQRKDKVTFLSFGTFHEDKNIALLIEAGEVLYAEGEQNFVISINGACGNWEDYQKLIHHQDIFELDIRALDNSEIANLFECSHYVVFPYKQSGQSGVLKVAMRYNRPVIVSNLEGFTFEITDNFNGYVFENNSLDSLVSVLKKCIHISEKDYFRLQSNMRKYVEDNYSVEKISNRYLTMFDYVMQNK